MIKTRPTVLAAVIAVVVLALGTSGLRTFAALSGVGAEITQYALPSPLTLSLSCGRIYASRLIAFVVQIVLLAAVVLLVSWLGSRSAAIRGGFWAVLFSVWMAPSSPDIWWLRSPPRSSSSAHPPSQLIARQAMRLASNGGFFGLVYGWIAGIVAGIVHEVGAIRIMANGKPGTTSSPGS